MREKLTEWMLVAFEKTYVRKLVRQLNRLWVRIVVIGVLSLVAIIVARLTDPLLPDGIKQVIGAGSIESLLQIIANSMLAVTTFSLTVMVSVYRSASNQWTPRVHRLMLDDQTTQNTLATMVGAYIYALASIVLLETQLFADDQVVVLFCFTIFILILIIVAIVRWIVHLQTLGSLIETTRRIEAKAREAFAYRMARPCLGANALHDTSVIPADTEAYKAPRTGYVQYIYEGQISEVADAEEVDIYLIAPIGRLVFQGEVIVRASAMTDTVAETLDQSIAIGDLRTFEQDPRFGLVVLSEIGSKALSPGINDPGTAIDVLGRMSRIFDEFKSDRDIPEDGLQHPRLWVPPLVAEDMIEDAFAAIGRDGGNIVEVQLTLQKALAHLARHPAKPLADAAKTAARRAFERAEQAMTYGNDLERLRRRTPADVQQGDG